MDALRGFALLGIVVANLPYFAKVHQLSAEQLAAFPTAGCDHVVTTLQHVFVTEKFYSLFSLLFGVSFGLQAAAAKVRGLDFRRLHRTRMGWLLVFGLIHSLIWIGDILVVYALVGLLLPLFVSSRPRTLLIGAAACLTLPIAAGLLAAVTDGRTDVAVWFYELGRRLDQSFGVPRFVADRITLREHVLGNIADLCGRYGNLLSTGRFFKVLAMFLLGLWIVRTRLLAELHGRRSLLRRVAAIGLLLGLPANILIAGLHSSISLTPGWHQTALALLYAGGVVPLCLACTALFALGWQRLSQGGPFRCLAPLGRMALTNYLMQTAVGISLFYGIGCGWAGRVSPTMLLLISLAIFALQLIVSHAWLRRFPQGPCEWCWRTLVGRRPLAGRQPAPSPATTH